MTSLLPTLFHKSTNEDSNLLLCMDANSQLYSVSPGQL